MILFQQKQDGAISYTPGSGQTRLLEIASNCAWDRVRPKVLAWLSDLTKNCDDYPQMCTLSVGGFRVEVQPRPKQPTEIPMRLQESIGMSSMLPIRVRITAEAKLLPAASRSVSLLSAAESAALRLRDCNGLNVRSLLSTKQRTTTDVTNTGVIRQSRDVDVTQQKPTSLLARHSTQEITTNDSCQKVTAIKDISQQKTDVNLSQQSTSVDISQHVPICLSENTDLSSKDDTSLSNSACPRGSTLQKCQEPSLGVTTVRTAAEDTIDHCSDGCSEDVGSDSNGHINTSSQTCCNNSGNCVALEQPTEDATRIKNDGVSIGAEMANGSVHADDRNFLLSADNMNFPSSSGQTCPAADCTEVTCSLQADDGNFPSSSGLSVPLACPLDLRT